MCEGTFALLWDIVHMGYTIQSDQPILSKFCEPGTAFVKLTKGKKVLLGSHIPLPLAEKIQNLNFPLRKHWVIFLDV